MRSSWLSSLRFHSAGRRSASGTPKNRRRSSSERNARTTSRSAASGQATASNTAQHDIVVEQVAAANATATYPRCLCGRRAAPPDDCGGIGAYEELLEALADPGDPDHAERLEWLDDRLPMEWDPASFDRAAIDAALLAVASDAVPGPVARPVG